MPLKKEPNVNYQTYSQAMAVVQRLRNLGVSVYDIREVEIGSLADGTGESGIPVEGNPNFEADEQLHQYTARIFGGARQQLGIVGASLGTGGRDAVLKLAQSCIPDQLRALQAVWDLPVVVSAADAALKG